jgi:LPXTG-site transpeptidase (sortase) family protein
MRIRRPAAIGIAAGLVVIVAGTVGLLTRHSTPAPQPPPRGVATVPAPTASLVTGSPSASPRPSPTGPPPGVLRSSYPEPQGQDQAQGPVAMPVSLTIPVIGVKAPLITLGLAGDGTLNTQPLNGVPRAAGWYNGSVRPGAIGPAVIAGHIDYGGAEGVFWRLDELRPGDLAYVRRADGTTVEFRVTSVQSTPKADFPTGGVYGATPDAELRLITCGGTFDPATGHYLSNTIVYTTEVT